MIPGSFEYHRPASVDEALSLLATHGEEGRLIAGGHSLVPMMKLRLAAPEHLIDLRDLADLRGVREAGGVIEIGAMTSQHEIVESELLQGLCPILRETAVLIADPQVRYCGTLGGNVANGDPGNDMPAVMQCLGASYLVRNASGEREIPARDFYEGAYFTALGEDELLTTVRIPQPPAGHGFAYEKLKRKVGDYATAAAAVVLTLDGGSCGQAAVALTNVGQTPIFVEAAGQALVGTGLDDAAITEAARLASEAADPVADLRGPPEFKRHTAGVMARRAIARARDRAAA